MSLSRRRFIESASLTVLASAVLPAAFAQGASRLKDDPFSAENADVLANVSEETFKPFIGDSFDVMNANRLLDTLTLFEVTAAEPAPTPAKASVAGRSSRTPATTSFSLRFHGSATSTLEQRIYTVENASLGSFPLFLTPGNPEMNPPRYIASFSLLVQ